MMKMWCIVLIFNLLSNYGSARPAAVLNGNLSVSNQEMIDPTSYLDSFKSSIYDATSKASNLMGSINLINDSPFISLTDKTQYLRQLSSFSLDKLFMISDVLSMLGDAVISHLEWKLKIIKAAKVQFDLAMKALENGDIEAAKKYFFEALYTVPRMCPLYQALKYALEEDDIDMMSFVGKMGQLILGRMETSVVD